MENYDWSLTLIFDGEIIAEHRFTDEEVKEYFESYDRAGYELKWSDDNNTCEIDFCNNSFSFYGAVLERANK